MKKTIGQVIFETDKPEGFSSYEEYRQYQISKGTISARALDLPSDSTTEQKDKKTLSPRSVNHRGHDVIRGRLKKDTQISEIIRFLVEVVYDRLQRAGGEVDPELKQEWKEQVELHLDELSLEEAVKVSYEWLNKVSNLGEFGSKGMNSYLRTKSRIDKPYSEEVETSNFFKED